MVRVFSCVSCDPAGLNMRTRIDEAFTEACSQLPLFRANAGGEGGGRGVFSSANLRF
jgi:hypothetical protein